MSRTESSCKKRFEIFTQSLQCHGCKYFRLLRKWYCCHAKVCFIMQTFAIVTKRLIVDVLCYQINVSMLRYVPPPVAQSA